jgi:hypothetical protein
MKKSLCIVHVRVIVTLLTLSQVFILFSHFLCFTLNFICEDILTIEKEKSFFFTETVMYFIHFEQPFLPHIAGCSITDLCRRKYKKLTALK